jgi:hypothetical protein
VGRHLQSIGSAERLRDKDLDALFQRGGYARWNLDRLAISRKFNSFHLLVSLFAVISILRPADQDS